MHLNRKKVKIIAEVHPQHHGDMDKLKRMVLQCKIGGADYVKVQVYNSEKLFNDDKRKYLEFNEDELQEINSYCLSIGIKIICFCFFLRGCRFM